MMRWLWRQTRSAAAATFDFFGAVSHRASELWFRAADWAYPGLEVETDPE